MGDIDEKMDLKKMCEMPGYHLKCSVVEVIQKLMECYFYHSEEKEILTALGGYIGELVFCMHNFFPDKKDMIYASRMLDGVKRASAYMKEQRMDQACVSEDIGNVIAGMYSSVPGETLAAVWKGWADSVCGARSEKIRALGKQVWEIEADESRTIQAFVGFYKEMGMPVSLGQLAGRELLEEEIDILSENIAEAVQKKAAYFTDDRQEVRNRIRKMLECGNHW